MPFEESGAPDVVVPFSRGRPTLWTDKLSVVDIWGGYWPATSAIQVMVHVSISYCPSIGSKALQYNIAQKDLCSNGMGPRWYLSNASSSPQQRQTQAKVTFPTHSHIKFPWNMSSKTSDKCIISTSFKPPQDLNPRSKWNLPTFHFLTFLWPRLWPLIAKHLWHHIIPAMQSLGTVETQQVTKATTTTMKLQHLWTALLQDLRDGHLAHVDMEWYGWTKDMHLTIMWKIHKSGF